MNITVAYLFQHVNNSSDIVMVWESAEISDMYDAVEDGTRRMIGTVNYNVDLHKVVDQLTGRGRKPPFVSRLI